MKTLRAIFAFGFLAGVMNTTVAASEPAPFMQRVDPVDFLQLEKKNEVSYATSAELVIYRSAEGRIKDTLVLAPKGEDYALKRVRRISGETTVGEWMIPASTAKRIIESIKLMMEYGALPPPAGRQEDVDSPFSTNCWIWLRITPTQTIAGMVSGYKMHSPRGERAQTFCFLIKDLDEISEAEGEAPPRFLKDIDLISEHFLEGENSTPSK